jgi:hypothetical protein
VSLVLVGPEPAAIDRRATAQCCGELGGALEAIGGISRHPPVYSASNVGGNVRRDIPQARRDFSRHERQSFMEVGRFREFVRAASS